MEEQQNNIGKLIKDFLDPLHLVGEDAVVEQYNGKTVSATQSYELCPIKELIAYHDG